MTATCTRCGDTSAAACEDWNCHEGWLPDAPPCMGGYLPSDFKPTLRDEYVIRTEDLPPGWTTT